MRVSIVTVGDELLIGRVVDTHAAFAAALIEPLGAKVIAHRTVGDPPGELQTALIEEARRAESIIVTGGLGPTEDDRTREECAEAAGVALEFRPEWWERIAERYRRHGFELNERNRRQAYFPAGAVAIENPYGSAPAFRLELAGDQGKRTMVWCLPGVPDEFHGLLTDVVIPAFRASMPTPATERVWTFHGVPESALDAWLVETLADHGVPLEHHVCVREGEIEVRSTAPIDLLSLARKKYGSRCLGEGDLSLPERVVVEATRAGGKIALAESCTGGRIADRLIGVPGSSRVLECGWVTYANQAKERELGVPLSLIEEHGAVSAPVAEALAQGALERSDADWCVSTTGVAGPSGGTELKPVGLIWFGVATRTGVCSGVRRLRGDRERIRAYGGTQGFACLLAAIRGENPFPWS